VRRPRFTIASLVVLILFVAVSAAALREANDVWDSGVFGLTALALLASVLLAVHQDGRRKAFWLGFALFGGAYLFASLVPPVEARLPTTKGLAYLDSLVPGRTVTFTVSTVNFTGPVSSTTTATNGKTIVITGTGSLNTSNPPPIRFWNAMTGRLLVSPAGTSENFVRIGHSLLALALAFAGGRFSRALYVRNRERVHDAQASDPAASPAVGLEASRPET
jgi:hypothetical protein